MAILESLLPMKKSAGNLTFKHRKSDGRVIVTQKIETFHNHRTTRSMQNKLSMTNTVAMYRYLRDNFRENIELDDKKRNAYQTYVHLNKTLTRCWLPQKEMRQGNAILEPHFISNGTLKPVLCHLESDGTMRTDIVLGLNTLDGVTVGDFACDVLEHNADYRTDDLLRLVYLLQTTYPGGTAGTFFHRIKDHSLLLMLDTSDGRQLSDVLDTSLWGVSGGRLALLQPLSYAAATVVHLRPQVHSAGYTKEKIYSTLRQHLAAGFPLATYVTPDAHRLACKVSRQQLLCDNPLIEEYATEERFAEAARTFGPIRDTESD